MQETQETWLRPLGWGGSPGGGHDNPLQYSCLEYPVDRGVWQATVHGIAKSWAWLSDRKTTVLITVQFRSVQSLSRVRLFATPWIAARQASLSITNSQSLLKLMYDNSRHPINNGKINSKVCVLEGHFRQAIRLQEGMENKECCKYVNKTPWTRCSQMESLKNVNRLWVWRPIRRRCALNRVIINPLQGASKCSKNLMRFAALGYSDSLK